MDKIMKYVPYVMVFVIGMITNRIIAILGFLTDNEMISNIIGLIIGIIFFVLWKLMYYKLVT
jgi:uncharacterized membrane protein (UPF0136 family)